MFIGKIVSIYISFISLKMNDKLRKENHYLYQQYVSTVPTSKLLL